jgi:hypothetical protein
MSFRVTITFWHIQNNFRPKTKISPSPAAFEVLFPQYKHKWGGESIKVHISHILQPKGTDLSEVTSFHAAVIITSNNHLLNRKILEPNKET